MIISTTLSINKYLAFPWLINISDHNCISLLYAAFSTFFKIFSNHHNEDPWNLNVGKLKLTRQWWWGMKGHKTTFDPTKILTVGGSGTGSSECRLLQNPIWEQSCLAFCGRNQTYIQDLLYFTVYVFNFHVVSTINSFVVYSSEAHFKRIF